MKLSKLTIKKYIKALYIEIYGDEAFQDCKSDFPEWFEGTEFGTMEFEDKQEMDDYFQISETEETIFRGFGVWC